jgi:hypothetical protein
MQANPHELSRTEVTLQQKLPSPALRQDLVALRCGRSSLHIKWLGDGHRNWDHILIDGDHSFQGCWSDFQTVRNNARAIAFHDIVSAACPGVVEVWQRIKAIMPDRSVEEFTDQYSEVQNRTGQNFLGIGVVAMG